MPLCVVEQADSKWHWSVLTPEQSGIRDDALVQAALQSANGELRVTAHQLKLSADNIDQLFQVLNCTDGNSVGHEEVLRAVRSSYVVH